MTAITRIVCNRDGKKDVKIFAKGLHENIYSVDFVIDSFKHYIQRVFREKESNDTNLPVITLISKNLNSDDLRKNIGNSKFVDESKRLSDKYNMPVLKIMNIPEKEKQVHMELKEFSLFNDLKTIEFSQQNKDLEISRIKSFSVFEDFYRCRVNENEGHKAYINFYNSTATTKFREIFQLLENSSTKIIF
ncbi:hypothetical protein [uncultured Gammaproteobacteria bacterium]|nr:hypothetical protein [uncultured Gammaproteobacteria bacterium]CAC9620215.1 hypothetical protein [uncultured Gammaproteobacteria bacterium]